MLTQRGFLNDIHIISLIGIINPQHEFGMNSAVRDKNIQAVGNPKTSALSRKNTLPSDENYRVIWSNKLFNLLGASVEK